MDKHSVHKGNSLSEYISKEQNLLTKDPSY